MKELIEVALGDHFPGQCEDWLSVKGYLHEVFKREREERKSAAARRLADSEESLQHALREEVVHRVIGFFPYVHFQ